MSKPPSGAAPPEISPPADFPTRWGNFRIFGYQSEGQTAVVVRTPAAFSAAPLLRIHSQCLTGDVFGSLRCDCRDQLELALQAIAADGDGLVIYEDQEGRGIGLLPKLRAYALQDAGADTVEANRQLGYEADLRAYRLPVAVLHYLGVRQVRLLSNNPAKVEALEKAGIAVVERVACAPEGLEERARKYLAVKREKLGHLG